MANTIQIKRKTTSGAPDVSTLLDGEMLLVVPDQVLYQRVNASTLIIINGGSSISLTTEIINITKNTSFTITSTKKIVLVSVYNPSTGQLFEVSPILAADRLSGTIKINKSITNAEITIITQ